MLKAILENNNRPILALAPMAGASDKAMRILAQEYGADMLFSEMISAKALTFSNEKTEKLLDTQGEKGLVAIQLFGHEEEIVSEAGRRAVALGAQWLDFNMGCPVPKVVNNHEGSALLKSPEKAINLMRTLVQAVDVPVSVKCRIGWDCYDKGFMQNFVQGLAETGISLLSVHGRTRQEYYTGKANWQAISDIVEAISLPVFANGDVDTPQKAKEILDTTGACGIMIGRGAMGRPWLFSEIKTYLGEGILLPSPSLSERATLMLRHAKLVIEDKGEYIAMREMRKHVGWYVKELRYAKILRQEASSLSTLDDLKKLLRHWQNLLET